MSVPLQKMPRRGIVLLALLLCVSGCAPHDSNPSRARVAPKYVRPAPVQPAYSAPEPFLSAPAEAPSPPVKAKKRPPVKAAEPSAPRVVPVLDNSLPEQIWQPAVTRQTSLELKS
ncbi:hypothetical protein NB069_15770 [Leclercia adecarboxylata]|uniref:hypothetical protein n=1 Tax=Leclercia adecarboxylata TaxID=83655 RepID=UPI00202A37AF|nr:hypothetical protein [Leclercia adecarboxylata]URN98134.1 hypothetical protein NB069_15770 [Leclercia adecarboxylata]